MFVAHLIGAYIFNQLANKIVVKINRVEKLDEFLRWFRESWSLPSVLKIVTPWAALWAGMGVIGFSFIFQNFVGVGYALTVILTGSFVGLCFHMVVWLCLLALNLRNYEYDLNAYAPADSEVISNISTLMTKCVYWNVMFFAIATFVNTSKLIDPKLKLYFGLPFLLTVWLAAIAQFFLTRSTLGAIVSEAKWKTLNRIQDKINAIEAKGDLANKEIAERLMQLAEIHKQIMRSKNQFFDWDSISNLFSQLMLPVLGLLLGNLDQVMALFKK
jgi:hypothetical protein